MSRPDSLAPGIVWITSVCEHGARRIAFEGRPERCIRQRTAAVNAPFAPGGSVQAALAAGNFSSRHVLDHCVHLPPPLRALQALSNERYKPPNAKIENNVTSIYFTNRSRRELPTESSRSLLSSRLSNMMTSYSRLPKDGSEVSRTATPGRCVGGERLTSCGTQELQISFLEDLTQAYTKNYLP